MSHFTDVRQWMGRAGQTVRDTPDAYISAKDHDLRKRLMKEELTELLLGMETHDIVEIADGIGDLLVVTYGTAVTYGVNADAVFTEVNRSNYSKFGLDGAAILDEGGKVMKGPHYDPPNIKRVLERGW